jgi:hypothetical protein
MGLLSSLADSESQEDQPIKNRPSLANEDGHGQNALLDIGALYRRYLRRNGLIDQEEEAKGKSSSRLPLQ